MQSFDESRLEDSLSEFKNFASYSKVSFNVGVVAQKLRLYDDAIHAYSDAIEMDPFFAAAYYQRAALYFYSSDMEGAINDYKICFEVIN